MNTEIFIKRANIIHNHKYDYSLVDYKKNYLKIKIICPQHGIFEQDPSCHVSKKQGCPLCAGVKKMNNESFIDKANDVHHFLYDYSLVEYINNKTKIKIICKEHGIFEARPDNHLNKKSGCPKCANNILYDKNIFVKKCNVIHHNKYDYSLVDYKNAHQKIKIICPTHGLFEQMPHSHINGVGCPICSESKGEKKISFILDTLKIKYEREKSFENCRYKYPLPFDFYLLDYNICIEYDGPQHFESIDGWGGEEKFKDIKIRDSIKNEYCENNNITLIRIKYDENINSEIMNIIIKKLGE